MPTIEDLGKKMKEKFPGQYDDLSDVELGRKTREKYPQYADFTDTSKAAFTQKKGTAAEVAAGASKGDVSRKARPRLATLQAEGAKAGYEQEMTDIKARAVGEGAAMLPFAAAAPFTGGASVPAGMALMGAAGFAGGVAREEVKALYGSSKMPESGKALALSLGLDVTLGTLGEGTGRALGAVGKTLLPKLIQRSAAKSDSGAKLLEDAFFDTRQTLYGEIQTKGTPAVDVEKPLREAYDLLAKLPRAKGKIGERFGGMSEKASEIVKDLEEGLSLTDGGIATKQPLDGLIRAKGSLQKMAWQEKSLNKEEAVIFKRLSERLDDRIKVALKDVGPEAEKLYKKTNDLLIVQKERDAAVALSERFVQSLAGKAVGGAVIGSGLGTYHGRSVPGAVKGALVGAAAGTAMAVIPPGTSAFILEKTMSHPEAAQLYRKAIGFFIEGSEGEAANLARRALVIAGARNIVKSALQPDPMSMQQATGSYLPQP